LIIAELTEFPMSSRFMNVHTIPSGLIQTNAYLLTDPVRQEAVLVDAPGEIWPKIKPILDGESLTLRELWITHGHWDHTQGGAEVVRETRARVIAHVADQVLIETPEVVEGFMGEKLGLEGITVDQWVSAGETLTCFGQAIEVRHVPGHCPGNVMFVFADENLALVGDAIFAGSIGRTDLPGGSFEELAQSIRSQIYTLPEETKLYPGHGPVTTVGIEKQSNPHVPA
jgi:glyoxylase-like metal-dependent hydrolase (beta-lactamase superfamily II)